MEGVPGPPPAGGTHCVMEGNSSELIDKLKEKQSAILKLEDALRTKRLKSSVPGLPRSRRVAITMDIERTETNLQELVKEKERIEEELQQNGTVLPEEGADHASKDSLQSRRVSVSPTFGTVGASQGVVDKEPETTGALQKRRISVSPTFGITSNALPTTKKKPLTVETANKDIMRKSFLLGQGQSQNQTGQTPNKSSEDVSIATHHSSAIRPSATSPPSQTDRAQDVDLQPSVIETLHHDVDFHPIPSAQNKPFSVPISCHNSHPRKPYLTTSTTSHANASSASFEKQTCHSSHTPIEIQNCVSPLSSVQNSVKAPSAPLPMTGISEVKSEQNDRHLQHTNSLISHVPCGSIPSLGLKGPPSRALEHLELTLKKVVSDLKVRTELFEKIDEIRGAFKSMVESSESKFKIEENNGQSHVKPPDQVISSNTSNQLVPQSSQQFDGQQSLKEASVSQMSQSAHQQIETLQSELTNSKNEITRLEVTLADMQKNLEASKVKSNQTTSRTKTGMVRSLSLDFQRAEGSLLKSGAQTTLPQIEKEVLPTRGAISEQEKHCGTNAYHDSCSKLNKAEQRVEQLEQQRQLEAKLHVDLCNNLKRTSGELKNSREINERIQRDFDTEKAMNKKDLLDIQESLESEKKKCFNLEESNGTFQKDLETKQRELDSLKSDFDSKCQLLEDTEIELNNTREIVESIRQNFVTEKKVNKKVLKDVRELLQNEKEKSQQLEESNGTFQTDLETEQRELDSLKSDFDSKCQLVCDLREQVDTMKTSDEKLKEKMDFQSKELEELNLLKTKAVEELKALRSGHKSCEETIKSLKDRCDSLLKEKESSMEGLKMEHDSCKETIKLLMEKNSELETQLKKKDSVLKSSAGELSVCSESFASSRAMCESLHIEKDLLSKERKDLENKLTEKDSCLKRCMVDRDIFSVKEKSLVEELSEFKAKNDCFQKEKSAMEKEFNAAKEKIKRWAADIASHRKAVAGLEKQLEEAEQALKEKTSESEKDSLSLKNELEALRKQLAVVKKGLADKSSELEMEKKLKKTNLDSLMALNKTYEGGSVSYTKQLEVLKKQLAEVQKSLDDRTTELEMEKKLQKTKLDSLMALNATYQGGSNASEKLANSYKDQLISAEEELKQSVSELKEARRLLARAVRKVGNDRENSDAKSGQEAMNVILLAQDVSKLLLYEFDRAQKLAAEVEVLKNERDESLKMRELKELELVTFEVEKTDVLKSLKLREMDVEKLKNENQNCAKLYDVQKSEMDKLKKSLRASQAKLELEQVFLRECRLSLEAEQKLLLETQARLEAETGVLKDCQSKLAKEQASLKEASALSKILQKNVDDSMKLMNDFKEKYRVSEARFAAMRLTSLSDYSTGSETSSGSSPVLDSGDTVSQSIGADDTKALDLTVGRNLIKDTHSVSKSSLDSRMRSSGEYLSSDMGNKKSDFFDELNKELTLVQNENCYLENCLKDLEKDGRDCQKRCQELSELNLSLVRENSVLCAKVDKLQNCEQCHEKVGKDEQEKCEKKNLKDEPLYPSRDEKCEECAGLERKLKCSEDTVHSLNVMFRDQLAKCIIERDEVKEKYLKCDKLRSQLEKEKITFEARFQYDGEHDVVHCRLRLKREREQSKQLNDLLQREHEELEKCRKERDQLDVKLKEVTEAQTKLEKDKKTLLIFVKEFQIETSGVKKKAKTDQHPASDLDLQSSVKVQQWLEEQEGRHLTSPVKANVDCKDCHKLQKSLSDMEHEKQELAKNLAEMNEAYDLLAGMTKEEPKITPDALVVSSDGKRKLRAKTNSTANPLPRGELHSVKMKLESMTDTKRKCEESLVIAHQSSADDRQKLQVAGNRIETFKTKLKVAHDEVVAMKRFVEQLKRRLDSEIQRNKMLSESENKLTTKLESKDYLIEDLALELKGTKSKMTQQVFDSTDANTAMRQREHILTDLAYRARKLCSNCSTLNIPRSQDVDDLKQYLRNMERSPKGPKESFSGSEAEMRPLVDDYGSSSDEMEEVRSVRISSPRNIQHVDENLHEKDIAELKKHNRKLTELYQEQERLIGHLSKEKMKYQELASQELQDERLVRLEAENKDLRKEVASSRLAASDLVEKAQKRGKNGKFRSGSEENQQSSERDVKTIKTSTTIESGDMQQVTLRLNEAENTSKNLRGQLQVERLAVKSLKDEKGVLEEMLEKSENEVKLLRLRFLDLSRSECEQKMEFALLQGDAKLWATEKDRLQEVLWVSRNEVKALESTSAVLQGSVDDLRKELGAARLGCATLKDEAKVWGSEKRQLAMDLEVAENESQKFKSECDELTKLAKGEEGKIQELTDQVKKLQENELELKRQIQVSESDVKDKSDRIEIYEGVLKQVKNLNVSNNFNQQLEIVRGEKQQVLKILSQKEKEVALLELDTKQKEAGFKEALEAKENSLLSLQSGITVLTRQLNSSRSKAVSLLQMIQEKETEIRDVTKKFEAQIAEREDSIASLDKRIKELDHNFGMLKNEHEIANVTRALDENLVAELRRDFEVMEHKVAELKFQNMELNMKKTELTDKNFEFLTKIEKLEKVVAVKDDIMEACKEQLVLMSNQLDLVYNRDNQNSQGVDLQGLALKQAKLNEQEAKLAEKEILEQKRLDALNQKEKNFEKRKNALRNRETDLKKREEFVENLHDVRSKVKDNLNGCLSEVQTSRKEEYQALDDALNVRDDALKVREKKVNGMEADLVAREELLNGCHLEIQELAAAVTTLEGDVGTLKESLYAKDASLNTYKSTYGDLEKRLESALDELQTEKQKRKLRSCAKVKSVKTMTDFDALDVAVQPSIDSGKDDATAVLKPEPSANVTSALTVEVKDVKSSATQTLRIKFNENFCSRCGLLLEKNEKVKFDNLDDAAKTESSDNTSSLDYQSNREALEEPNESSEVVMEAETYLVVTDPLQDAASVCQELCVANKQVDGTLSISPLKDLSFGAEVAVLQTACELAVEEEAMLIKKFEELRASLAEMKSEMVERESCSYKELETIKQLEEEIKRIIANLTGEIRLLEAKLTDAQKETPELKSMVDALEKYLASERVAHGDTKTKYINEKNLNVWLEKQLQEARTEIDLVKISVAQSTPVLDPEPTSKETCPTLLNLLYPLPSTSTSPQLHNRKRKSGMKSMVEPAKVAKKSPSKAPLPKPKSPARPKSPGRAASPRDRPKVKQALVPETKDVKDINESLATDIPTMESEEPSRIGPPEAKLAELSVKVVKAKKEKVRKRMWYPCTICHKTFTDPFFFKNHLRCHERQQFFCTLCDKNFSNKRLYTSHLLMHQPVEVPEYRCRVCNELCTSAIQLKIHMIKHPKLEDSLKPYKCIRCNKAFVLKSGLKSHSRVHKKNGRKNFSPKRKPKQFRQSIGDSVIKALDFEPVAQNLEVDMKNPVVAIENLVVDLKSKEKVVTKPELDQLKSATLCPAPEEIDKPKPALMVETDQNLLHVVTKADKKLEIPAPDVLEKKELRCPHCPKVCSMQLQYQRHLLVHSGAKDHVCTLCNRAFPLKCNLVWHMKGKHEMEASSSNEIVVQTAKKLTGKAKLKIQKKLNFACEHCKDAFRFKKELKKHVLENHKSKYGRKKPVESVTYTCPMCEKKFYLQTKLVCHMETEHLIPMDLNTSSVESPVTIPPKCIPSPEQISTTIPPPGKTAHPFKFFCPVCQKGFNRLKKLKMHKKVHSMRKSLETAQSSTHDSSGISLVSTETLKEQENLEISLPSQGITKHSIDSQDVSGDWIDLKPARKKKLTMHKKVHSMRKSLETPQSSSHDSSGVSLVSTETPKEQGNEDISLPSQGTSVSEFSIDLQDVSKDLIELKPAGKKKLKKHKKVHSMRKSLDTQQSSSHDSSGKPLVSTETPTEQENLDISFTFQGSSEVSIDSQDVPGDSIDLKPDGKKKLKVHKKVYSMWKSLETLQSSSHDSSGKSLESTETLKEQENLDISSTSQGSLELSIDSQDASADSIDLKPAVKKSASNMRTFYCSVCEKFYPNRKQLSRHKRKHNLAKRRGKLSKFALPDPELKQISASASKDVVDINMASSLKDAEENAEDMFVDVVGFDGNIETDACDVKTSDSVNAVSLEVDDVATAPTVVEVEYDKFKESLLEDNSVAERVVSENVDNVPSAMGSDFDSKVLVADNVASLPSAVPSAMDSEFDCKRQVADNVASMPSAVPSAMDSEFDCKRQVADNVESMPSAASSDSLSKEEVSDKVASVPSAVSSDLTYETNVTDDVGSVLSGKGSVSEVTNLPGEKKIKLSKKKKVLDLSLYVLECHVCGKRFRQKCNLMGHLKVNHELTPADIAQDILDQMKGLEYKCDICDRIFSQNCSYKLHLKMRHSGSPVVRRKLGKGKKQKGKQLKSKTNGMASKGSKVKVKRRTSGNKELLSLLDGPNLEQAALEEKCRSTDGIALKRPRKMLKIPDMTDELYTCHFCGKDYVTFSRYQTHLENCGVQNVSKKMKRKYEEFSPKAKLISSAEKSTDYGLDYDTEPYTDDSSHESSVHTSYTTTFSPDNMTRKQDFDQFELLEMRVQKRTHNSSPVVLKRRNSSVASGGSRRRTPNVSPVGSKGSMNIPPDSRRRTPSASPVRPKCEAWSSSKRGRSPVRISKKGSESEYFALPQKDEAALMPSLKTCQVMVTDCKASQDDIPKDMLPNPSTSFPADSTPETSMSLTPKYSPAYSDISDDEDDMPLNKLKKVVNSKFTFSSSKNKPRKDPCSNSAMGSSTKKLKVTVPFSKETSKSKQEKLKLTIPKAASLRISPRRRSWDVGQQLDDVGIPPSRQISRALTFSRREPTKPHVDSELGNEPKYKSYTQTFSKERHRHCSDDSRIHKKSRWDQPPSHLVTKNAAPALSIYDFQDEDVNVPPPSVKKSHSKPMILHVKAAPMSCHSKPKSTGSSSTSGLSKKSSSSGKSSKIHRKKRRWSSPKSRKKSPKAAEQFIPDIVDHSDPSTPNFALANFSPKRVNSESLGKSSCDSVSQMSRSRYGMGTEMNAADLPGESSSAEWSSMNTKSKKTMESSFSMPSTSYQDLHNNSTASVSNKYQQLDIEKQSKQLNVEKASVSNKYQQLDMEKQSKQLNVEKEPEDFNMGPLNLTKRSDSSSTPASLTAVKKKDNITALGNRFTCFHCGETFKFHSLYNRHLKKEHSIGKRIDWTI